MMETGFTDEMFFGENLAVGPSSHTFADEEFHVFDDDGTTFVGTEGGVFDDDGTTFVEKEGDVFDDDGTMDDTLDQLLSAAVRPSMPIRTEQPTVWVERAPPEEYYRFKEGPLVVIFQTDDRRCIANHWQDAWLQLLYVKSGTPVEAEVAFKVLSRSIEGNTIRYHLKLNQITKNHGSRKFCLFLSCGAMQVLTSGFLVKTKRTIPTTDTITRRARPKKKRKRATAAAITTAATITSGPGNEPITAYEQSVHLVLSGLEWRITGYASHCEGFADLSQPLFSCPVCHGRREDGHRERCQLHALLR